jgi:BolA protein
MMGPLERILREKLVSLLAPSVLEITNESPQHGLPPEAERHFRVVAVSDLFEGLPRLERHRRVHTILAEELRDQVHALSVQAFTPAEWRARDGGTHASPACLGGGKKQRSPNT